MDFVEELIMLLDTELSRIELRLVAMPQNNPEWDVLDIVQKEVTKQLTWYKELAEGINEGWI